MPKQRRRKSPFKKILLTVLLVLVLVGVSASVYFSMNLKAVGNGDHEILFEVKEGENFDSVLTNLEKEGIIRSSMVAKLYAKLTHSGNYFAGNYELNDSMSTKEVLSYISDESNLVNESVTLTVPEGTWAKEIAENIAEIYPQYTAEDIIRQWNDAEYIQTLSKDYSFLNAETLNNENYKVKLEGYLFPETYFLNPEADIDEITRTLLNQFDSFYQENKSLFEQSEYSVHEIVTLASVVQFESGSTEDMPTIASVFYNRLNDGMRLESSVTVCYALYDQFDDPTQCETQTDIESPYNTYLNDGLPVGPILNPGADAIKAVLEPASTEYYFFAADINDDGKVYYSKTFEEHQKVCEDLGLILN